MTIRTSGFRQLLSQHFIAIIFAFFIGCICVSPQLFAPLAIHGSYDGYPFFALDDEDIYLSRIREIVDGHYLVGSPEMYEYKHTTPIVLPIGEYFYALPTILLRVPLLTMVILSKFLFPMLLFILIYALSYSLIRERDMQARLTAAIVGLVAIIGYDFIDPGMLIRFFSGTLHSTHMILWTRLVNPITGALLFFGYLLSLRIMYEKYSRWIVVFSGMLLGSMIGYFFSWAYAFVITLCLTLCAIFFQEKLFMRRLLYVVGISLIFQSFYWYSIVRSTVFGSTASVSAKNGMLVMSSPLFNKLLIIATIVCICIYFLVNKMPFFKKTLSHQWQWILSIVVAAWIVLNQQILTGRAIWPYHFVQFTIPALYMITIIALHSYMRKFSVVWYVCMISIVIICVSYGIHSAYSYSYQMQNYKKFEEYRPLYKWFDLHAEKDCVVFVKEDDDLMARLIPAFTSCNVYHSTYNFLGVPSDRVIHNYLSLLRLRGVSATNIADYLETHFTEVHSLFFSDWNELFSTTISPHTREIISSIRDAYTEFMKRDFRSELKKYRIDYIISADVLSSDMIRELHLKNIDFQGGYFIYQFE